MTLREEGYWDAHYEVELKNFDTDGDEGEIWFGKGLSRRIADWLTNKIGSKIQSGITQRIIDVGCGNAFMLVNLAEKLKLKFDTCQLKGKLECLGVDYSENSIGLSRKIIKKRTLDDLVQLEQCDFLDAAQINSISKNGKFNCIIDKGTFDAICLLASDNDEKLKQTKLKYLESLYSISKKGSIFVLASCNHTEEELLQIFTQDCAKGRSMKYIDRIETPTIQFGGKVGSQVTCLILELE